VIGRAGATDRRSNGFAHGFAIDLHLDDQGHIPVTSEDVGEARHADSLAFEGMRAAGVDESGSRIDPRELSRRSRAHWPASVRRALQCVIVVNDGNTVGREVHIELETVGAGGHPDVERRNRVLGTEGAATAMGKDTGPRPIEETHARFIL